MNNLIEYNSNNCDYTSYTGVVTVSVYDNDRLIKSTTSNNAGMSTLFNFICNCLKGDFKSARESRPCKLILLKKDDNESEDSTPLTDKESNKTYWSESYAVSAPTVYDTAAIGTVDNNKCDITYHFRIPSLNLQTGAEIKKLLLLPVKYTTFSEACAYYVLENEIKLPEKSGNITIIIDWKLIFSNKTEKKGDK